MFNIFKKRKEKREEIVQQIKETVSNGINWSKLAVIAVIILLNNILLVLSIFLCTFLMKFIL